MATDNEPVLAAIGDLRHLVEQQGGRLETTLEHVDGLKDMVLGVLHRVANAERAARDASQVATEALGGAAEARIKAAEAHKIASEAAAEAARAHKRLDQIPAAKRPWPWWLELLVGAGVLASGIGLGSIL